MSTACFLLGTSSSTGSPGLPLRAGRTRRSATCLRAGCRRVVRPGGATAGSDRDQPDPPAGRDHHGMSDWTWEYVPDAANVVGGLTQTQFLEDYRDDVVLVVRVQHFELSD